MKTALVALVLLFVAAMGVQSYLRGERPNDVLRPTIDRVQVELDGSYTVPECARNWPPSCPHSDTKPVPECARHWPATCKEAQ